MERGFILEEDCDDASSSSARAASGDVNSVAAADATPMALSTRKDRRVLAVCGSSAPLGDAADSDKPQWRGFAEGAKARHVSAATASEAHRSRFRSAVMVLYFSASMNTGRVPSFVGDVRVFSTLCMVW